MCAQGLVVNEDTSHNKAFKPILRMMYIPKTHSSSSRTKSDSLYAMCTFLLCIVVLYSHRRRTPHISYTKFLIFFFFSSAFIFGRLSTNSCNFYFEKFLFNGSANVTLILVWFFHISYSDWNGKRYLYSNAKNQLSYSYTEYRTNRVVLHCKFPSFYTLDVENAFIYTMRYRTLTRHHDIKIFHWHKWWKRDISNSAMHFCSINNNKF